MPSARGLRGTIVRTGKKPLGTVDYVLFHPEEPRVVGVQVRRPRLLMLFDRKPAFVALEGALYEEEELVLSGKSPSAARFESESGFGWDRTVIWVGMPVAAENGRKLGSVRDVVFGKKTGKVKTLYLTEGAAADAALGARDLPGELVLGFDGERVLVSDEALTVKRPGGAATIAGAGTAVVKDRAGKAVRKGARGAGRLYGRLRNAFREGFKD